LLPKRLLAKEIDNLAYVFVFFGALIVLPQVYQVYNTESAGDLNFYTYAGWSVGDIFWLIFALEKKIYPLLAGSVVKFLLNLSILYAIFTLGGV